MFPPVVARVNVAHYVLIFDVADLISLRGARYCCCFHSELFSSGNPGLFFVVIVSPSPADFVPLFRATRVARSTLALEFSNGH